MKLKNSLPGACALLLSGALLSNIAAAMPGAPMLTLDEACPMCAPVCEAGKAPRRVVVHDAAGPVYANTLPDWAEVLSRTVTHFAQSGEFARRHAAVRRQIAAWSDAPRSDSALPRAQKSWEFRWEVPEEMRGAFGRLSPSSEGSIAQYRTTWTRELLMIDGDDAAQRRWAERIWRASRHAGKLDLFGLPRIVVMQGATAPMREMLRDDPNGRVWFDQGGVIRRRIGLPALPAVASTSEAGLRVTVFVIDEEGNDAAAGKSSAADSQTTDGRAL